MDSTPNESVMEEVVKQLALHIKSYAPLIKSVLQDFPEPNEKLVYPCVSIFTKSPKFEPLSPYLMLPLENIANKTATVKYVVGRYDFKLQLDIWARNKEERVDVYDMLFNALNPVIQPMGLSLRLKDYYNIWCRYDLSDHDITDDERSSQTAEFRMRLEVLANCRAIRVNKGRIVEEIQIQEKFYDTSEDIAGPTDDTEDVVID